MESHPQGAAGSTPKGGQPRSAMAGVLLFVTLPTVTVTASHNGPFPRGPAFREVGACRCWPRRSRNRVSIPAGPQRRIPRILGAGVSPAARFSACRETLKRACRKLHRSGARAHLCKLRLRAVRASPRHPIALPPLETIRQSAGLGVAVAAAATSTVGSGAGAAPAARRPARDPRRRRGTETAARSALRTAARYPSTTQPPRIAQRANLGPLRADFPSPPRPPLPDRAGPGYRAHGKHSALWAVAPTRSRQAAPLPVRCSLGSGAFALGCPYRW